MLQNLPKKEMLVKFLRAYEKSYGNISQACLMAGISRQTFYRWKAADAKFAAALLALAPHEALLDVVENALMQRIRAGDTTAIIYALKTKGRRRGWGEKVEHTGGLSIEAARDAILQFLKDKAEYKELTPEYVASVFSREWDLPYDQLLQAVHAQLPPGENDYLDALMDV